jgi:hypothetical protein
MLVQQLMQSVLILGIWFARRVRCSPLALHNAVLLATHFILVHKIYSLRSKISDSIFLDADVCTHLIFPGLGYTLECVVSKQNRVTYFRTEVVVAIVSHIHKY